MKKPYLKFNKFTFSLHLKDDITIAQLRVGKKPVTDHKADTYKWEWCEEQFESTSYGSEVGIY